MADVSAAAKFAHNVLSGPGWKAVWYATPVNPFGALLQSPAIALFELHPVHGHRITDLVGNDDALKIVW